jgi:osmotically-inducible protein OsmY
VFEDAWITTKVKLQLMELDNVPALDVNVDTFDRKVTLFGIVPNAAAKLSAETAAKRVDNVESVHNEIQVVADAQREAVEEKDETLADRVEEALDATTALDGAEIDVEVKNGVVRLTGELEREAQRLTAVTTARGVPGVKAVTNDLRLETATDE